MAKERMKPLPVALSKAQHEYLESKPDGKAGFLRKLLEEEMRKKAKR